MKHKSSLPDEAELSSLLRGARPTPDLPRHFQEDVWRRIERTEPLQLSNATGWLDVVAAWALRPRLALAFAAVLVAAGISLGWTSGERMAQSEAQARYVALVAPNAFH